MVPFLVLYGKLFGWTLLNGLKIVRVKGVDSPTLLSMNFILNRHCPGYKVFKGTVLWDVFMPLRSCLGSWFRLWFFWGFGRKFAEIGSSPFTKYSLCILLMCLYSLRVISMSTKMHLAYAETTLYKLNHSKISVISVNDKSFCPFS